MRRRPFVIGTLVAVSLLLILGCIGWINRERLMGLAVQFAVREELREKSDEARRTLPQPSVQTEKFRLVTDETGLTFPSASRVVEFCRQDQDDWYAKVSIPEAAYPSFKETVSKKPDSSFGDVMNWPMPYWWNPVEADLSRMTIGSHFVFSVKTVAAREGDHHAVYLWCECH